MKKLLSLFLALALLFSSAPLATANSLQAQGEALLRSTLNTFASGAFTLNAVDQNGRSLLITRGGDYFLFDGGWSPAYWITSKQGNYYEVLHGRRVQFPSQSSLLGFLQAEWIALIDPTMPATVEVASVNGYVRVSYAERSFYYRNSQLQRVTVRQGRSQYIFNIDSLNRQTDPLLDEFHQLRNTTLVRALAIRVSLGFAIIFVILPIISFVMLWFISRLINLVN